MKRAAAVALLLIVAACGKRGDPRPPVPVIPKATSDLVVTQRGSKVILTWSYPSLTTAGESLRNIKRVVLYRAIEPLPAQQAGRDASAALPSDADRQPVNAPALFARIPTLSPAQFTRLRDRIDSIEGANLPSATSGAHLIYEDAPAFRTTDGRPVRLTYAVVTEGTSARSDLSNLVSIVPLNVPAAPGALTAAVKPEGILLSWEKPQEQSGPAIAPVIGYNVYRRSLGHQPEAFGPPVNPSPLTATTFTDTPAYGDYEYIVRAVAAIGPPAIESEPTPSVSATFKDLLPPPAPGKVTALVETNIIRLVWDPVSAPDLAGYNIYRTEGGVRLKLTPAKLWPSANFFDIGPVPGSEYIYSVTAVDTNGNESAASSTDKVSVPKTP